MEYTLKDYKDLLEKVLSFYDDPMNCPCTLDPYKEGKLWRQAKQEAIVWALEMLPEIKE